MPQPLKPATLLEMEKGKLYNFQAERVRLEPKPQKEIKIRCPKRFNKEERKEWKYFTSILKNYGLLTIANAPLIEILAVNNVQYKKCLQFVAIKGVIVKGPKGQYMYNPWWNAVNKLEEKICRCLADLGLSSTGLARIGSLMVKSKKEKEEFFGD